MNPIEEYLNKQESHKWLLTHNPFKEVVNQIFDNSLDRNQTERLLKLKFNKK